MSGSGRSSPGSRQAEAAQLWGGGGGLDWVDGSEGMAPRSLSARSMSAFCVYFLCSCFIAVSSDITEFTLPDTLTWSQPETLGTPPSPRHGHVMVAAGTKLFIHGGLAGDRFYDDLHCIDISKQGGGHGNLSA